VVKPGTKKNPKIAQKLFDKAKSIGRKF